MVESKIAMEVREMTFWDKTPIRLLKHILGWILRPRYSYLRLREIHHARSAGQVKNNIALDDIPSVTLIPADTQDKISEVIRVYARNPSGLLIAPRSDKAMKRFIAKGYEYYLVAESPGKVIGAVGLQPSRALICHRVIDFDKRGSGYGLACSLTLLSLMARKGYPKAHGQVFKKNRRALSAALSIGYKIEGEDPEGLYYLISKNLTPQKDSEDT